MTHDSQLTTHDSPLTTHAALQSLARLPWFTEGEMPLEVRQTLLAWLEREHPETHYRLREGLHRLLAQNPPPEGSAAYDDYAMNLALNEWLYTRNAARKKELQRDIAARLAAGQQADFMVLRMLDPGRSLTPEQFEVPEDWKKHLREKGFAFLNPRRAWWWAVPIWLVLCGLGLWWQPERVECGGLNEVYQEKEYCIENVEEWAIFKEIMMKNALFGGQESIADSIFNQTIIIGWSNHNLSGFNNSNTWSMFSRLKTNDRLRYGGRDTVALTDAVIAFDNRVDAFNLIMEELSQRRVQYLDVDKENPIIDSISFLQNAAVAYFNEGAKIHKAYSSMWEVVERSGQKPAGANYRPRSEACAYFTRAQEINALLPDTLQLWYVRDAAKCSLPVVLQSSKAQPIADITIFGRLLNAKTNYPLGFNDLFGVGNTPGTRIESSGLRPALIHRGASFTLYVPGDRRTPVTLTVTAPGFESQKLTVRPADFGKELDVKLNPLEKCYAQLRAQGEALMNDKKYEDAVTMFTTASQCADAPETNDLRELIERAGNLALYENQRKEQQRLDREALRKTDEQQRLDAERQANADDDGDGVANKDDKCPTEKGIANNGGCPVPGIDLAAVLAEIDANMVTVAGGSFQMGCDDKIEGECESDEKPIHKVQLDNFYISKYEVTQEQWIAVMSNNPSEFNNCNNCPVENVSWNDVQVFLTKLNALTGRQYRLPTEAEWEYAAQGGRFKEKKSLPDADARELSTLAWFSINAGGRAHAVGQKLPNALGVFDMRGNISEWCLDWYAGFKENLEINPKGGENGKRKVCRGGGFVSPKQDCRITNRNSFLPDSRNEDVGFRLVKQVVK